MNFLRSRKYDQSEISAFLRELSLMLDSGMSLYDAVETAGSNREFCADISSGISHGNSLSAVIRELPIVIDGMAVDLIRSGEGIGDLSGGLKKAALYLENKDRMSRKIIGALIYPIFVMILSFAALFVFALILLPSFESIYSEMGIQLPFISNILSLSCRFVFGNFPVIVILVLLAGFFLQKHFRTEEGSRQFDRFLLGLPFFGNLRRDMIVSRFFDAFFQSIKAGIAIPDGLFMSRDVTGSPVYRDQIDEAVIKVKTGGRLSQALDPRLFPPITINLTAVGENTAKLDVVCRELKDYYEDIVERKIKLFTNLIEPISTLVVGAVVAIIVVAMFMPMIRLISNMAF